MLISIDPAALKALVSITLAANETISACNELLQKVATHDDWSCKEKNKINQDAIENKSKIKKLQDDATAFLLSIQNAANMYEEAEESIIGTNTGFDAIIFDGLNCLQSGPTVADIPAGIVPAAILDLVGLNHYESYCFNSLEAPLSVVKFEDIQNL